ncbi:MAG: hypothetical protein ACFFCV_21970, partial [Promethearchaeota archaeon]
LFAFMFLIQPPINYESLRNVPLLFFFLDVPIFIMIFFGFYNISNFEKKAIPDRICFVPVMLSNILPFLVLFMVWI